MKKKLPGVALVAPRAKTLRESLPAAVGERRGGGEGAPLQLVLPAELVRDLKVKAAAEQTTVRAIVLRALVREGFKIDPAELGDRRRAK
jgi:hypothetical protein